MSGEYNSHPIQKASDLQCRPPDHPVGNRTPREDKRIRSHDPLAKGVEEVSLSPRTVPTDPIVGVLRA